MCVDTKFKNANDRFGIDNCAKDQPGFGGEQVLLMLPIYSLNSQIVQVKYNTGMK